MQDIAAFLVDVMRPFSVFAAQTAYFIEPVLGSQKSLIRDLAQFLEDPDQMDEFIDQLYKDKEDNG